MERCRCRELLCCCTVFCALVWWRRTGRHAARRRASSLAATVALPIDLSSRPPMPPIFRLSVGLPRSGLRGANGQSGDLSMKMRGKLTIDFVGKLAPEGRPPCRCGCEAAVTRRCAASTVRRPRGEPVELRPACLSQGIRVRRAPGADIRFEVAKRVRLRACCGRGARLRRTGVERKLWKERDNHGWDVLHRGGATPDPGCSGQ
jgi:hypothetical protein